MGPRHALESSLTFELSVGERVLAIYVGLLAFACFGFWFFRPSPAYDVTRVEPRLRSLQTPYQTVRRAYYMDGGGIGIEIVDRTGQKEQFAIPAHLGDAHRYDTVFVGAMHDRKPGATKVADSENTKQMLIRILATTPGRTPHDDYCLMSLRRRPSDYATVLIHWLFRIDGKATRGEAQRFCALSLVVIQSPIA